MNGLRPNIDVRSLSRDELTAWVTAEGEKSYRADQIFRWLDSGAPDFSVMNNIPETLRRRLAECWSVPAVGIAAKQVSAIDGTAKYLMKMDDGETVESVLMSYRHGWSQCLSTQVGCRMGCTFCATGMGGLVRNLTPSEILGQLRAAAADAGTRIGSLVLMGMGEPLDNYDNVIAFLRHVTRSVDIGVGMRHVSLSTCGVADAIERLSKERLGITLSVSLHAPDDTIRSTIMPVNRRWPVDHLLDVCEKYADVTGRRVSYEYAMMRSINDSDECAALLASKLKGSLCHVNLIPANPVYGSGIQASDRKRIQQFLTVLDGKGIAATIRRTLGADIAAACGQLRGSVATQ